MRLKEMKDSQKLCHLDAAETTCMVLHLILLKDTGRDSLATRSWVVQAKMISSWCGRMGTTRQKKTFNMKCRYLRLQL